jgi:hypothetical protein
VFRRFSRWSIKGVWWRIFETMSDDPDFEYLIIDSTIVRAHQHAAGAKKGSENQAIGRSRGGLVVLPSWPANLTCPTSSSAISSATAWLVAAMLTVGSNRRTLRNPHALNGALRQFASVTSLSRGGGKPPSSSSTDIHSPVAGLGNSRSLFSED